MVRVWEGPYHPNGISPKVNVIERLDFQLAYFDATLRYGNYNATKTYFKVIFSFKRLNVFTFSAI